jgi:hypothetical protein
MRPDLRRAAVAAGQHKAGSEGVGRFAWCWNFAGVVGVDVCQVQMLRPGALQRSDTLSAAAHRFCARGRRVCRSAIWYVSVGDVSAARRWRLRFDLVMETEGGSAADGLRRPCALAVRVGVGGGARFVSGFRIERAVTEK